MVQEIAYLLFVDFEKSDKLKENSKNALYGHVPVNCAVNWGTKKYILLKEIGTCNCMCIYKVEQNTMTYLSFWVSKGNIKCAHGSDYSHQ